MEKKEILIEDEIQSKSEKHSVWRISHSLYQSHDTIYDLLRNPEAIHVNEKVRTDLKL